MQSSWSISSAIRRPVDPALKLCRENDVFLVEDAAQAFGNIVCGPSERKLGLLGDAGFFSFGRGKPISALHGGLAVTGSAEIREQADLVYRQLEDNFFLRRPRLADCISLLFLSLRSTALLDPQDDALSPSRGDPFRPGLSSQKRVRPRYPGPRSPFALPSGRKAHQGGEFVLVRAQPPVPAPTTTSPAEPVPLP